jgi:hypothetical protein
MSVIFGGSTNNYMLWNKNNNKFVDDEKNNGKNIFMENKKDDKYEQIELIPNLKDKLKIVEEIE